MVWKMDAKRKWIFNYNTFVKQFNKKKSVGKKFECLGKNFEILYKLLPIAPWTILDLKGNKIGDEEAIFLSDCLKINSSLTKLNLEGKKEKRKNNNNKMDVYIY